MGRKNRSPEENERRAKIRELLQARNISSMDDIQNLFKETIAEFMKMDWMQNWMTNSVTASTITRTRKLTTAGMDTAARRCVPASVMWRFPFREIAKENMNRSF